MVSLAKAASNHAVTSMIIAGIYDQIPLCHYKQAVMAFNNCYNLVSSLIRSDAKVTTAGIHELPKGCMFFFSYLNFYHKKPSREKCLQ